MRVLFDNGALLDAAGAAGFDVFVTTDRNLQYQQNLTLRTMLLDDPSGNPLRTWPPLRPSAAAAGFLRAFAIRDLDIVLD